MRMIFALICMLLPISAQAQQAWGDEGGCTRVAGNVATTDMVFVLWPDRIERHESTCRIVGIEGDLATRAVIETECSGEGETWIDAYGMTPVGDNIAIWPVDAPDFITELRLCE